MTRGTRETTREHAEISDESTATTAPLISIKQEHGRPSRVFPTASFAGAVFILSTNIIGAGIMALPAAMRVLGLVPGIILIISVAILTDASIEMLIRCSRAANKSTYGGVMGDAFRKIGRRLLQITVVLNNVGILTVYMIIIGTPFEIG